MTAPAPVAAATRTFIPATITNGVAKGYNAISNTTSSAVRGVASLVATAATTAFNALKAVALAVFSVITLKAFRSSKEEVAVEVPAAPLGKWAQLKQIVVLRGQQALTAARTQGTRALGAARANPVKTVAAVAAPVIAFVAYRVVV